MAYQVSFFIMNYIFLAKGSSLLNPSLGECTNTITNISNAPAYSGMESIWKILKLSAPMATS